MKPQPTNFLQFQGSHILVNINLDNFPLANMGTHILVILKLDILPWTNPVKHILANLCKFTLSRVTFRKVNLSRAIHQATSQVLRKDIYPSQV